MRKLIMQVLPKSISNREKRVIVTEVITAMKKKFMDTGRLTVRGLGTLSLNEGEQEFKLDNETKLRKYVKGTLRLSRSFKSLIKNRWQK